MEMTYVSVSSLSVVSVGCVGAIGGGGGLLRNADAEGVPRANALAGHDEARGRVRRAVIELRHEAVGVVALVIEVNDRQGPGGRVPSEPPGAQLDGDDGTRLIAVVFHGEVVLGTRPRYSIPKHHVCNNGLKQIMFQFLSQEPGAPYSAIQASLGKSLVFHRTLKGPNIAPPTKL